MKLEEFKYVILPLKDKLFRMALRIIRNQDEAEDIVQDVMIKVWNMGEEWTGIDNSEAYCCTMTRHLALQRLALKENRNGRLQADDYNRSGTETPGEAMEKDERMRLLRKLINGLPDKQRHVVQLRDVEGMSYLEIARTLEITEDQVKTNLFRARQEIKGWFLKIDRYGLRKN